MGSMPALSGTLVCAKKRDVVEYEGTLLLQGAHDDVKIKLLLDEIEDSVEPVERPKVTPKVVCANSVCYLSHTHTPTVC